MDNITDRQAALVGLVYEGLGLDHDPGIVRMFSTDELEDASHGVNRLKGCSGDGDDAALMGAGDHTFVWNPGNDKDTPNILDGGDGDNIQIQG